MTFVIVYLVFERKCVLHTCCIHDAALADKFVTAVFVLWFPTKSEKTQVVAGIDFVDVLFPFWSTCL